MITDGRCADAGQGEALVARVAAAARAGVHLVQIREPRLEPRALGLVVEGAVLVTRGTGARVLVNDRVDVALGAGAHGVHLRGDAMSASRVRAIAPPGFLVGRSVHARDEAVEAAGDGGVDYLMFGTIFETGSKPGRAPAGLETLASVAASVPVPVLAVGGMVPERLQGVREAGACGFAAIGLFASAPVDGLQLIVQQASLAFDTPRGVP
jgi:thiamine-phosphate diphosphorylase